MRKLFCILILALTSTLAYAQRPDQIELPCPAGSSPTWMGQSYDQATGKYRQWQCVKQNGTVTQAITDSGNGGQVYNVKAYGAAGDGSTDDASSVKKAIEAASGNIVYFPLSTGAYNIGSTLPLDKPDKIVCAPGVTIKYTPTSGTLWNVGYSGQGGEISGCTMIASGTANNTTAVTVGTLSPGADGFIMHQGSIGTSSGDTFKTAISINPTNSPNSVVNETFDSVKINDSTFCYDIYGSEQTLILNPRLNSCATGVRENQYASDVTIVGGSIDSITGNYLDVENQGITNLHGVHFETNQQSYSHFIYQNGSQTNAVTLDGGQLLDDRATGTQADFVNVNCQYCTFNAFGTELWSRGITVTTAVNFAAPGSGGNLQLYDLTPPPFSHEYQLTTGSPQYSKIIDIPGGNTGAVQTATFYNYGIGLSSATVATLPAASTSTGQMWYVTDSTTISAEGQTCAGSGTVKALAFSTGAAWKCF